MREGWGYWSEVGSEDRTLQNSWQRFKNSCALRRRKKREKQRTHIETRRLLTFKDQREEEMPTKEKRKAK